LKVVVAVDWALGFGLGMVDEHLLNPMDIHFSQQLVPVPAGGWFVTQVANANIGIKNVHPGFEIE
jgi:hypothetical protein